MGSSPSVSPARGIIVTSWAAVGALSALHDKTRVRPLPDCHCVIPPKYRYTCLLLRRTFPGPGWGVYFYFGQS